MNLKQIKCVVVDFDETLYSNGDWLNEDKFFGKYLEIEDLLSEFETLKEKVEFLEKKYPGYHIIKLIFAHLHENGIDDSGFREFIDKNIYEIRKENTIFIRPEIVSEIAKYYKIYIVSDSSVSHLEYYLDYARIDKKAFSGIYNNKYDDEGYTKIPIMKKVLKETGLRSDEIIMIGDSENSDIRPAKLMGFQTKHIKSVSEVEELFQELINLKSPKRI